MVKGVSEDLFIMLLCIASFPSEFPLNFVDFSLPMHLFHNACSIAENQTQTFCIG